MMSRSVGVVGSISGSSDPSLENQSGNSRIANLG